MKGRLTLVTLVVVLLLVSLTGVGCKDAPRRTTPTPEPGGTLTGEQILRTKCVYCHKDDRIDKATYDLAGWEATIDRMDEKGATVNEVQKATLAEYLANRSTP